MKITQAQLEILCDIAQEAGRAIMELYEAPVGVVMKADQSPLTEADTRADAIIRRRLEASFPGVFILSEESASATTGSTDGSFFLVDPLDGTKEFLNRNGEFTVNIALVDGTLRAGVVYAPALGRLYYAAEGLGAFVRHGEGTPRVIRVADFAGDRPIKVVGSRSHGSDTLQVWLEGVGLPHELVSMGSSLKFCLVAEGAADIYPRYGLTSQWDTAAAQAVLEIAGGQVVDLDGTSLVYSRARAILNPFFLAIGTPALKAAALSGVDFVRRNESAGLKGRG